MSDETFRVMPHDESAERAVLGSAMLSKAALTDLVGIVRPTDFYEPRHETIWRAIADLADGGHPADAVSAADALRRAGELTRPEELLYLHGLISGVPTAANAGYYARIIRRLATQRSVIEAGIRITQRGYESEADPGTLLAEAQAALLSVEAHEDDGHGRMIGSILEDIVDAADNDEASAVPTVSWPYGPDMPAMPCGRLVIVAGRPGMGKSVMGVDAAREVAAVQRKPVAFFSLEMSQAEVGARIMAAEAKVPLPRVAKGEMTPEDWAWWNKRNGLIFDAPLWVNDFPRSDPSYIRSHAMRLARTHGDLGLVVVDYLQLMEQPGAAPNKPRQQIVSEFSRSLTIMAKELGCPVLALAQLNRSSESREKKIPAVSDLRESGSLEQDASQVILIHREDAYEKEGPRSGEVDLIIGKNRGGATGTITLAAQLHLSRFRVMGDRSEREDMVRAS